MSSKINNNSDVCHIYYDISVTNNTTNQPSNLAAVPCSFSQNRQNPYLNAPEDYSVTVPYLKIDSNNFPLQVIQPTFGFGYGPTFVDTNFSIAIKVGGADWTLHKVIWTPPDATLLGVTGSANADNFTNPFFYNYSYNYLLNRINRAIIVGCNFDSITEIPYFSFNPVNKKFSFNAPLSWGNTYVGGYKFGLSPNLYSLFTGLPARYTTLPLIGPIPSDVFYQLDINASPGGENLIPQYTAFTVPLVPSSYYIQMEQNFSSINVWNPVVSVVFIARNLNVIQTLEARPFIYGFNPFTATNNANVSNVLFEVPLRVAANPTIFYRPIPEYQLYNLVGKVETGELQIDVFWKDTYGRLNVFALDVGSTFIMKLLFRKKAFNY